MKKLWITIIAMVVVAGLSFGAGVFYQSRFSAGPRFGGMMMGGPGGGMMGGGPGGGGMMRSSNGGGFGQGFRARGSQGSGGRDFFRQMGERAITGRLDRIEDDKLVLTTPFGSVKVDITSKTKVKKTQKTDLSKLEKGKQIIVNVKADNEGKLSAKSVIAE